MKFKHLILGIYIVLSSTSALAQKRKQVAVDSTRYVVLLVDALKHEYLERNEEALLQYKAILKEFPKSAAANYGLYVVQNKLKMPEAAELNLQSAVKFGNNEWYLRELVLFYESSQKRELMLKNAHVLAKTYPSDYNQLLLAKAFYISGKPEKAVKILRKAKPNSQFIEESLNLMLTIGTDLNNGEWIVFSLSKLTETFPYELSYKGMLAEFYLNRKEYNKAFAVYQNIVKVHPGETKVKFSMLSYYIQTDSVLRATKILNDLVEINGFHAEVYNIFYNLMYGYLGSIPLNERMDLLERRIAFYPRNAELNNLAMDIFIKTNRTDKQLVLLETLFNGGLTDFDLLRRYTLLLADKGAIEQLLKVAGYSVGIYPNNPDFYLYNGIACWEMKKYEEAYSTLQQGISVLVDNNELLEQFYIYSAEVLYKLNRFADCFTNFDLALGLNSKNLVLLNNYAYYIVQSKSESLYTKANTMIEQCVKAQPNDINFLDTYAVVLMANGLNNEALQVITKALRIGGNLNPMIIEHYGDVLLNLGKTEDALREWRIALKLNKDSESLLSKIKKHEK